MMDRGYHSTLFLRTVALLLVVVVVVQERCCQANAFIPAFTAPTSSNHRCSSHLKQSSVLLQAHPPSWEALENMLGPSYSAPTPVSIDTALQPDAPLAKRNGRPILLFRERHGWCPYSERVWLALEYLGIEYDTIRIDNTGGRRPSYFNGLTPQIMWPEDGRTQGESYDLVKALDDIATVTAAGGSTLLQCDDAKVQHCVDQFRSIFPRARPSSRAAFLFSNSGEPLSRNIFEETLQQTDALLGQTTGAFFCGTDITGADIAWAPFLERYRYQLPCLHDQLEPDNAAVYPHLAEWYAAMETQIPAYACRVKGDASSWRKVLTMAGFGNAGNVPSNLRDTMQDRKQLEDSTAAACIQQDVWEGYASTRPYVAATPAAEAASIMARNRHYILADAWKSSSSFASSEEELDSILREMIAMLAQSGVDDNTKGLVNADGVRDLASFLDERMCVPRDMGAMSAACIKDLAAKLRAI